MQYFRDETEELLQTIDSDLLRLERFVDVGTIDVEIVNALFRALHTVKGSAGMLDFKEVQEVAHKLENLFDLLRKDRMPLSENCINILFEGRDFLTDLVHAAVGSGDAPEGVTAFMARLDEFASVYESTAVAIEGKRPEPGAEQAEAMAEIDTAQVDAFEAEVARLLAAANAATSAGRRPAGRRSRRGERTGRRGAGRRRSGRSRRQTGNAGCRGNAGGKDAGSYGGCQESDDPGRHRAAR